MTGNQLFKSAQATAKTFHEEFPGETPNLAWLAEAASIERIPDERRGEWEQAVQDEVKALQVLS